MNPSDVVVWCWVMPAMPEIGIHEARAQEHFAEIVTRGRYSTTINVVKFGKSITVKNKFLLMPSAQDLKTYQKLKTQLELKAKQKLGGV